jgi:glycosyltransferase involved in cell wall biosynthesis
VQAVKKSDAVFFRQYSAEYIQSQAPGMKFKISVVIPVYNAIDFIEHCLASVLAQRVTFPSEIIAVDDGSTDGTLEKLRNSPNLTCLTQDNLGPAAARNAGIKQATGDYIAFLDADDLWPEGKLQKQIELLEQHPDAAMCFGDCRQFEGAHEWPKTLFEEGGFNERAWGQDPYVPDAYSRLLAENFITTGSVVVRRKVLEELGGFDESLRRVEDLDLWLRIARHHPIIRHKEVCLLRRRHGMNFSAGYETMSLAYLEVLRREEARCVNDPACQGIRFKHLYAREYQAMADRALLDKEAGKAMHWAWRGFLARPSPRPLWRLTQAAALRLRTLA